MNRLSAYSLRLVCLCPVLLLFLAAPVLAQTETPSASPEATGVVTSVVSPSVEATLDTPAAVITPALTPTPTVTAVTPSATPSKEPPGTPLPTTTLPVAPVPTQTRAAGSLPVPTPSGAGGILADGRLVPLLVGGLLLLAGLAILGLLLMRRRRPHARPAHPAAGRAMAGRPTATLPPVGAETVTGVLTLVSLRLEGDPPQIFAINETPFAIGRDPGNQLVIDETFPQWQTVSREHALISRSDRGYVIEDLGSQNGVRVDGRLTPKNLLRNGAQVSIGGVTFRFVDETQAD